MHQLTYYYSYQYFNVKKRRTSLKDLADELGGSIATVSRALRNSHEVGEEMREKVKALAKKLNYRPNPFAQSLRKEAPKMIGVVLPNLVTHYYAAVLAGIEERARQEGYSVFSSNSHEDHNLEEQAIDNFIRLDVFTLFNLLFELVNEGLTTKLRRMPDDARNKFRETIERVINEGCSGLICILI